MNYSKCKEVESVAEVENHANMISAPRFIAQLHGSFSDHTPFLVRISQIKPGLCLIHEKRCGEGPALQNTVSWGTLGTGDGGLALGMDPRSQLCSVPPVSGHSISGWDAASGRRVGRGRGSTGLCAWGKKIKEKLADFVKL